MAESPTTNLDGPAKAWDAILKLAGAVTGVGVLLYFAGAATLWARYKAAGLPADKAVVHHPRGELVALGVRGTAIVTAVLVVLVLGSYVAVHAAAWGKRRRDAGYLLREDAPLTPFELAAGLARGIDRRRGHLLAVLGALAAVLAAWTSWKLLAVSIVLVTFAVSSLAYLRRRSAGDSRPSLWMIVALALATAAAGVCWQIEPPIRVQTVVVDPPPCTSSERRDGMKDCTALDEVAIPYLGETSDHVFVAEIDSTAPPVGERRDWRYTHNVLELRRNKVALTFFAGRGQLQPNVPSPLRVLWEATVSAVRGDRPGERPEGTPGPGAAAVG